MSVSNNVPAALSDAYRLHPQWPQLPDRARQYVSSLGVHAEWPGLPDHPGEYLSCAVVHANRPQLPNVASFHMQWPELPDHSGHYLLRPSLSQLPAKYLRRSSVRHRKRHDVPRSQLHAKRSGLPHARNHMPGPNLHPERPALSYPCHLCRATLPDCKRTGLPVPDGSRKNVRRAMPSAIDAGISESGIAGFRCASQPAAESRLNLLWC